MTVALRPYQIRAIDQAREALTRGCRAPLIVSPTGSGKTTIGSEIARRHCEQGGRVLWVAHRTELIDQAAARLEGCGLTVGVVAASSQRRPQPWAPAQVASVQTLLARWARAPPATPGLDGGPLPIATLLILDECVTGDAIVGGKRARDVHVGDTIDSWDGRAVVQRRVTHVFRRSASTLRTISIAGRSLTVTDNHPIWVEGKGYVFAHTIKVGDMCRVQRSYEAVCARNDTQDVLERLLDREPTTAEIVVQDMRCTNSVADRSWLAPDMLRSLRVSCALDDDDAHESNVRVDANDRAEPNAQCRIAPEDIDHIACYRAPTENGRGERSPGAGTASDTTHGTRARVDLRTPRRNWYEICGSTDTLYDRHREHPATGRDRGRRTQPPHTEGSSAGREERRDAAIERVDSVAVHERGRDKTFGGRCPSGDVYNFEVEGEHNFFANGILTHNCHHHVSPDWSRLAKRYADSLAVGLTATPEREDGTGLRANHDAIVVAATVRELTDLGHLAPLEVIAPHALLRPGQLAARPVDAYLAHAGGRRTVVFAPYVKEAERFAAEFRASGVHAAVVSGDQPSGDRARLLADYARGEIPVLCNVSVLSEGWDDPPTAVAILARGVGSPGLLIQLAGRVLRTSPGKTGATLIDLRGSVHVHGRPDEDRTYSLDGRGIRRASAPLEGKFCGVCGAVIAADVAVCECGQARETLEPQQVVGSALVKFARKRAEGEDARVATLARFLGEARARGYKLGAALHRYRGTYGEWPSDPILRAAIGHRGAA